MTNHIHAAECQICGKVLAEADVVGTYTCVHCKWDIRQRVGIESTKDSRKGWGHIPVGYDEPNAVFGNLQCPYCLSEMVVDYIRSVEHCPECTYTRPVSISTNVEEV